MSNQSVRFSNANGTEDNPYNIIEFFKPPRWIFNTTDPISTTGEDQWFFTNIISGDHFIKTLGTWTLVYNFNTGTNTGLTNIQNDGAIGFFKNIIGNTAHFKGISSGSGKITLAQLTNDVDLSVNINSSDVGLGNVQNIKSNFFGTADPNNFNDSSQGYSVGSMWLNRATNPSRFFICETANLTVAVWELLAGGSGTITTIQNVGSGAGILRDITANTANLKSLVSTSNKISLVPGTDVINLGVQNLTSSDIGLPLLINTKYVTNSAVNPTINDDASLNFQLGNLFSNYANGSVWQNRGNIVGAAVWQQIAGQIVRTDNDFIMVRKHAGNDNTVLTTGVNALLNVGFSVYDLIQSRGSWARLNLGFGPIVIQRTAPTNGIIGNNYLITYCWTGNLSSADTAANRFEFGVNVGTGSNPNAGFIVGSGSFVVFPANEFQSGTHSCSFVYSSPSATAENLFMTVASFDRSVTLITTDLTWTIQQI